MKSMLLYFVGSILVLLTQPSSAQVNSGSNGSDGAFTPTSNVTIDMADHPDGIYQYTTINIPAGVTVTFTPNAKNTPVVWLVQGDCAIAGTVNVSGQSATGANGAVGGNGGPGGWAGASSANPPVAGQGPGGGLAMYGGSYASLGREESQGSQAGQKYGNVFLLPLLGGSGGGGYQPVPSWGNYLGGGAGGGGGAILIVASASITINGQITSNGGNGNGTNIGGYFYGSGGGSGGGIRLVSASIRGAGAVSAVGGGGYSYNYNNGGYGGDGRVRIDTFSNTFGGSISGSFTLGFQPIILPMVNQGVQLGIASIGGNAVGSAPSGVLANPDVIIPATQSNPVNVVVNCTNVPLNSDIIITVHTAAGADVKSTAKNTVGSLAGSTATIPVNMPRGGGIIYASAVTGIAGSASSTSAKEVPEKNIAQTGWTANGEKFVAMEITAGIGGRQRISYITESGKKYAAPLN